MRYRVVSVIFTAALLCFVSSSGAVCGGSFINPISDVCWQCSFPLKVGGVTLVNYSEVRDTIDTTTTATCTCGLLPGIMVEFWQPNGLIDTVKDPYCFPALGTTFNSMVNGYLAGVSSSPKSSGGAHIHPVSMTFAQSHYIKFNVWALLDLFYDIPCLEFDGFDIAYLTELDPLWQDDGLSAILSPEALLFANPVAQIACAADAAATAVNLPLDALFWCMGSWGSSVYPLTGTIQSSKSVSANAGLAARMLYKLQRELIVWDTAINYCGPTPNPIWDKSHFRLHSIFPVKDHGCRTIGQTTFLWGAGKNPPYGTGGKDEDDHLEPLFQIRYYCADLPSNQRR